jgi:hypothetical protein
VGWNGDIERRLSVWVCCIVLYLRKFRRGKITKQMDHQMLRYAVYNRFGCAFHE